jgi:hypothetical protein
MCIGSTTGGTFWGNEAIWIRSWRFQLRHWWVFGGTLNCFHIKTILEAPKSCVETVRLGLKSGVYFCKKLNQMELLTSQLPSSQKHTENLDNFVLGAWWFGFLLFLIATPFLCPGTMNANLVVLFHVQLKYLCLGNIKQPFMCWLCWVLHQLCGFHVSEEVLQ